MPHVRSREQSPTDFAADIRTTRKILQDLSGQPVYGYRAASFSVAKRNLWALQEIEAAGYRYSSSVNPIRHDLYGIPDAPRFSFRPKGLELSRGADNNRSRWAPGKIFLAVAADTSASPLTDISSGRYGELMNESDKQRCSIFIRGKLTQRQPRQQGISLKTRFRHYTNLHVMEQRLGRLLQGLSLGALGRSFYAPRKRRGCRALAFPVLLNQAWVSASASNRRRSES